MGRWGCDRLRGACVVDGEPNRYATQGGRRPPAACDSRPGRGAPSRHLGWIRPSSCVRPPVPTRHRLTDSRARSRIGPRQSPGPAGRLGAQAPGAAGSPGTRRCAGGDPSRRLSAVPHTSHLTPRPTRSTGRRRLVDGARRCAGDDSARRAGLRESNSASPNGIAGRARLETQSAGGGDQWGRAAGPSSLDPLPPSESPGPPPHPSRRATSSRRCPRAIRMARRRRRPRHRDPPGPLRRP